MTNDIQTKTLSTRHYKAGYEIRTEEIEVPDGDEPLVMNSAYTPEGWYIGNLKRARFLCAKKGIAPELADKSDRVCTIGFSERNQKWYGWSHRAIYGFGIGDVVKDGDCAATSGWTDEYLTEHPEADTSLPIGFVAKDLGDAKQMAIAFADSVS
jgi:hypothetical protein